VDDLSGFHVDASLEAVILNREHGENFVLIEDTVTGDEVLGSDDLGFDWVPGADARLAVRRGRFGIAGRFFGGFEWDESAFVTTPAIWNFPTVPPLFGLGVANIDTDYESELHTAELSLTLALSEQIQIIAGARGLVLDETLTFDADFGGNTATITAESDNIGIGPQIGVLVSGNPGGSRLFLDGEFRGGLLFTESDLDFGVVQGIGPAFAATGDDNTETVFGEASLGARFQVTENIGIRGAYNVMIVDDLSTAPSIISEVDVVNGTIGGGSDRLLVHGARFGVVGRF
jgi:hypothetical protein